MKMKNDAKIEEQLILCSKLAWAIWWIFIQTLKNLKNLYFNRLPFIEVDYILPKKIQGSYAW